MHNAVTNFSVKFDEGKALLTVSVSQPVGDTAVIPEKRNITFVFKDIEPEKAECDGYDLFTDESGNACVTVKDLTAQNSASIVIKNANINFPPFINIY